MKTISTAILFCVFLTAFVSAQIIHGVVVDPEGKPNEGADVSIVSFYDRFQETHQTRTDSTGKFSLDLADLFLPERGNSAAAVSLSIHVRSADRKWVGMIGCNRFQREELQGLKIPLSPPVFVRGKVVDQEDLPLPGASVGAYPWFFYSLKEALTDENGEFEFVIPRSRFEHPLTLKSSNYCASKKGYAFACERLHLHLPPVGGDTIDLLLFKLGPAKSAKFHVVDPEGKPMSGIRLSCHSTPFPWDTGIGWACFYFDRLTDSEGNAAFNLFPANLEKQVSLEIYAGSGYSAEKTPVFDPKEDSEKTIEVKMVPPVLLGGTIRTADGGPLAETLLSFHSRGYGNNTSHFYGTTKTDKNGKYSIPVYPDQVYLQPTIVDKNLRQHIYQIDERVIMPGQPISDFDFVTEKVYKVSGEVEIPEDLRSFFASSEDYQVIDFNFLELSQDENKVHQSRDAVDSRGNPLNYSHSLFKAAVNEVFDPALSVLEYEVYLPKGDFKIVGKVERQTVKITGEEPETRLNLAVLKTVEISRDTGRFIYGRVVRKDGDQTVPVAGVIVQPEAERLPESGYPQKQTNETATNQEGKFHLLIDTNRTRNPIFFARTSDLSEAGFAVVARYSEEVVLELHPAASIRGRLIDPKTGTPLSRAKITCTGPYQAARRMILPPNFEDWRSDEEGWFSATGFVPGQIYILQCEPSESAGTNAPASAMVGVLTLSAPGEFDAGEIFVKTPEAFDELGFTPFQQPGTPQERFEKALESAKTAGKPVLLLFVQDLSSPDHVSFKMWLMNAIFGIPGQKYLANYEYLPIDVTDNPQAAELAAQLGTALPGENEFTIVVCDSTGKVITRRDSKNFNAPHFKSNGELTLDFDPVLLLTFLQAFGKK